MGSPVHCGDHDYLGFEPCPRCAFMVEPPTPQTPIVLNGERLIIVTRTKDKPRWIPGPVWDWMVRTVIKSQHVEATMRGHKLQP
jgi:hypothetical protein